MLEDKGIMQEQRAGQYGEKVVTNKQNTSHQHVMGNREVSCYNLRGVKFTLPEGFMEVYD